MTPRLDRILVATDFSACAEVALDHAIFLRDRMANAAPIDVLHVWEAPMYAGTESVILHVPSHDDVSLVEYVRMQAEAQLTKLIADREKRGQKGLRPVLRSGHPVEEIVQACTDSDLLVMGTQGRGALAHLLLGSVAERVVRNATCPVLTIRTR